MKNKKKIFFSFTLIVILFLAGFFLIKNNKNLSPTPLLDKERGEGVRSQKIKFVQIGGQTVKVDLALTEAEQTQGLSGRLKLDPNAGMLFVFDHPDKYQFWMPDMNFSIDMIWLTSDMKVDYIAKDATPESYPATFGPGANDGVAKYVLEVPTGFAEKNHLQIGDSASLVF